MSDWKKTRKEYYRKDCCIAYGGGVIDFAPDSMNDVHGGEFKSYGEYLDVQMHSCRQSRNYFELCYYHMGRSADFKGQIERVDEKRGKVIFRRVMVEGMHSDGIGFYGKEDHVWMDIAGFEQYQPGDCVRFTAEIYRYMRRKQGKLIDYALEHPEYISSVASYEVSTDEELIDQQINQLVCETCRYYDHCFMDMCLANEQERKERFEILKSLEPGKFTPMTVLLAYELEYRMLLQSGGIKLDKKDKNYAVMKRFEEICASQPIYCTGDVEEAFARMLYPDKPRLFIE